MSSGQAIALVLGLGAVAFFVVSRRPSPPLSSGGSEGSGFNAGTGSGGGKSRSRSQKAGRGLSVLGGAITGIGAALNQ